MPDQTVAGVNLGSNSFHMIVARVNEGQLHIVDRMRERVRLASGLGPDRRLRAIRSLTSREEKKKNQLLTTRNFNPVIAMAADTVIVTAEHIVPVGVRAPDHVVTPAPVVDYLIANE